MCPSEHPVAPAPDRSFVAYRLRHCIGGRWNAKPSSALRCPTCFQLRPLPMVRAPCPIAADEPRRALDDDGDSLERPMNRPTLGGYKLTRMCAAAAPTHRLPVARRPTSARPHAPLSLYARRPISSCRRPRRGGLRHRRRACNQARQTGALPPWLGLPGPIAAFTPLDCTPMLQAFNCYIYRENLKKRVKARLHCSSSGPSERVPGNDRQLQLTYG